MRLEKITIRVESDVVATLKRIAAARRLKYNGLVRNVLRAYCKAEIAANPHDALPPEEPAGGGDLM